MSAKTQFWLGSVALALAFGLLVGGFIYPRPSFSQEAAGEGRSGNYALISGGLPGIRPKSQVIYVVDDRNEAVYVLETISSKTSRHELHDVIDLREYGTKLQKRRAIEDKKGARNLPRE